MSHVMVNGLTLKKEVPPKFKSILPFSSGFYLEDFIVKPHLQKCHETLRYVFETRNFAVVNFKAKFEGRVARLHCHVLPYYKDRLIVYTMRQNPN